MSPSIRVFADQFNLVDMLAHVRTAHAQHAIIRDIGPLIDVITQFGKEMRDFIGVL